MERLLETVTGYSNAQRFVHSWVSSFSDGNGENRMVKVDNNGLHYSDDEGSGEFIHARCVNFNEAENADEEIYEIYCLA